jgi:hypothetical protein
MSTQTTPLPVARPGAVADQASQASGANAGAGHHRRQPPDDHLCTCGRLRADCVRDAVRALWAD